MSIIFWILLIASTLLEIVDDICFKHGLKSNRYFLVSGFVAYLIGSIFWLFSLKYGDIGKVGVIFCIVNSALLIMSGMYFFDEQITNTQAIGMMVGIFAIYLINC